MSNSRVHTNILMAQKKNKNLRVFGKSESKNDFFECAKEVETDGGVCVNIQER